MATTVLHSAVDWLAAVCDCNCWCWCCCWFCCQRCGSNGIGDEMQISFELQQGQQQGRQQGAAEAATGNTRPTTVDCRLLLASAASCWFWFAVTIQVTPQTAPYYIIVTACAALKGVAAAAARHLTVSTVAGKTTKLVYICGRLRGR